ncbi:calcium-binding protein 39 [Senna tora]|uniref:Calcium-binding protein 39 n=1 Tax=Senna tora TaxID=362788 RepID=A0A834X3B6_9FABA|nr:calcium-binding protein 39 [Senna tora]
MSFSFFKILRPKTPPEVAKSIKDSLMALDTKTVVEALEEVEKNFVTMRCMLSGDGESEPNVDQVSQLVEEVCKGDIIALIIHKLPVLGWEARKDLIHCWSILLKQKVDSKYCCVEYIEQHPELLDFLVVCFNCNHAADASGDVGIAMLALHSYDNKEIALNCGIMLRECIKFPALAKYLLESPSFELFFKFVELPNFDVASDAFSTFKDLLTKHGKLVSEFLADHYSEFFDLYEKILTSTNYVTRRQSLKILSEFLLEAPNSPIMKRYIQEVRHLKVMMTLLKFIQNAHLTHTTMSLAFEIIVLFMLSRHPMYVFVANPNKPRDVKFILTKNREKLLELLHNLSPGKGSEDEQFEEEKEFIIQEIERVSANHSLSCSLERIIIDDPPDVLSNPIATELRIDVT